jgi:hypothetical protein
MILDRLAMTDRELEVATGWEIKPEGLCRDDRCVPLGDLRPDEIGRYDMAALAERFSMPLVIDGAHGLGALGPESGGRVLADARMPALALPDFAGDVLDLASLRGRKVLLLAWASW